MTQQMPEKLFSNDWELKVYCGLYLPEYHPRINKSTTHVKNTLGFNTANWRGYIGEWKIEEKKLYLVNLQGQYNMIINKPIFANWVTGLLHLTRPPYDNIDDYSLDIIKVGNGLIKQFNDRKLTVNRKAYYEIKE